METMREETASAVNEFARQLWKAIWTINPVPEGLKALPNDKRFHMTEDSFQRIWEAASYLYIAATKVEISPDSPAFDLIEQEQKPKSALRLIKGGKD